MNLYRRRLFAASLLLVVIFVPALSAVAQRRTPHKLRATALLELTTSPTGVISSRLTPIVILDGGQFFDASIYKARPRPMAAEIGIVYEAQKSGVPAGYVTITGASNSGGMWTAMGKWQSAAQVEKVAKKEETPSTPSANPDDERPILHRDQNSSGAPTASASPSPQATPAQSTPTPEPQETDDSDRPILRRRSPGPDSTPSPEAQGSGNPTSTAAQPPRPVAPSEPGTQTMVAVSDNQPSDERSFAFQWKAGEQEAMEAKMRHLALAQLPPENAALKDNALQNVVIRSFDLDLSNEPVMVLTAEIPGSYMTPNKKNTPGKFVSRYITLIARADYEQNLQRMAVSITDSSRLDVAPRLELIDAVDVDGDGAAELLFREYGFDQKGFIVYGVGRGAVTKVFEGANSPLQ
ncbi:MAG: hypothetical protein ACRD4I_01395 [Candidatus Angelobacter sp.]